MSKVELTPAKLAELRQKAKVCHQEIWEIYEDSVAYTVAACGFREDAEFIAAANPATVLAMVEEIAVLQRTVRNLVMKYQYDAYDDDIEYEIDQARHQLESEAGQ